MLRIDHFLREFKALPAFRSVAELAVGLPGTADALLRQGPDHVAALVRSVERWLTEREYVSVEQMKGSLSQQACPDPAAFERTNYMRALTSYTGGHA